jgi:hypothetical protein
LEESLAQVALEYAWSWRELEHRKNIRREMVPQIMQKRKEMTILELSGSRNKLTEMGRPPNNVAVRDQQEAHRQWGEDED